MFKQFCFITLVAANPLLFTTTAHANTSNAEKTYSGAYTCKGNNNKVGDYGFSVTLKLNKSNSHDEISVYDLLGETENSTMYSGNAVAIANKMALAFRVSDHKENIFGSGFAVFKLSPEKLWTFTTHYYEPNETGGVSGTDVCTQLATVSAKKAPEDVAPKKAADETAPKKAPEDSAPKKAPEDAAAKKAPDDANSKKPSEDVVRN